MKIISLSSSLFCCSADLPAVVCATSCLWPFGLWPFNLLSVLKTQAAQSWTHTHTHPTRSDAWKLERDVSMKNMSNASTWTQTSAHDKLSISEPYLGLVHLESSSEKSLQYRNICQENEYNLNHSKHDYFFSLMSYWVIVFIYCRSETNPRIHYRHTDQWTIHLNNWSRHQIKTKSSQCFWRKQQRLNGGDRIWWMCPIGDDLAILFVLPSQTWLLRRLRDLERDYSLAHQRAPSNKQISGL